MAEYYRKSAEQGMNLGFYNLGILSCDGPGLKQSYENAVKYLTQSALMGFEGGFEVLGEGGNEKAQYELGIISLLP